MPELNTEAAHSPSKTGVNALSLGREQAPIAIIGAEGEGRLSVTEAARALAGARHRNQDQQGLALAKAGGEQRHQGAQPPTAEESPSALRASEDSSSEARRAEADAASRQSEIRGEIESADPGAQDTDRETDREINGEPPPIEPPRSWTKEDKELFTSLPRATQERIAERERSRESDFLRRQNEAADKLKGLAAREQTAEQARQHYEAALPQLLATLQQQQAGEFADIKTLADVERLAREDWPRYALWDVQQRKIADVTQQLTGALARQLLERQQRFSQFAQSEDELLKEKLPELADVDKAAKLQNACLAVLKDLGFEEAELVQSWHGQKDLSLRDHRVQLLIRDATLWREAQQKAKAAATKPVPPVQRPGVAQPKGAAQAARIESLSQQLETAKGVNALRAAADLVKARRASR
jgi:hypothetical protein